MPSTKKSSPKSRAARKLTPKKPSRKAVIREKTAEIQAAPEPAQSQTKAEERQQLVEGRPRLPNVLVLSRQALVLLWHYRWVFLGITVVYAVLNVLLVRGLGGATDVSSVRSLVEGQYHGGLAKLISGLAVFGVLLSQPGGSDASDSAGIFQTILILIISLALVWALRQAMAGHTFRVRDAFYLGMYPLIPVVLIVLLLSLELVPLVIGVYTFGIVATSGIASVWWQYVLWGAGCGALVALSFYFVCSSLFAAYIAAVPEMTPMRALRSARSLVRYRRLAILRKLLFLPLALLIVAGVLIIPIALLYTPAAPWVAYVLSMVVIAVVHAYLYTLYRELLV